MRYNVIDFGAVGDGAADDSESIQRAINACGKTGGTVIFPSDRTFLSSSIMLKPGVELHLEKGALLKATGDIHGYIRPSETLNDPRMALIGNPVTDKPAFAFIYARKADNISITGEGTIDGNCYAFVKRINEYYVTGYFYPRPTTIYIENCKDVFIGGVTIRNAPFWTVHLAGCENALIDSVTIRNPLDVANSDGIDPDHCKGVEIRNCNIRCADDCICLKNTAGNIEYGDCSNIYVHDCELISTSAAIKIGTEGVADFHDISFERCRISASNRGISLQIRDSGSVARVLFKDISIETRRFNGSWWGTAEPIILTSFRRDKSTVSGRIKDVSFENIECDSENGVLISCDGGEIEDISFVNVNVRVRKKSKWECGLYDLRPCADHDIVKAWNNALRLRNCKNITLISSSFMLLKRKNAYDRYAESFFAENVNGLFTKNANFGAEYE